MEINFEVSNAVKRALDDMGFEKLTEIQEKAIPLILEGKDVIGKSQTGSGKTVAFGVPAIEMIDMEANRKLTQVLIMCPTRELAMQACGEFRKLTKYTSGIKTLAVYGGQPISRQIPLLRQGCQIVIGTPGRIMDHIRRKTLKLHAIKMLVLDEADEMLNMGFREDIETILKEVPSQRQTVLFSATMPKIIMDIVDQYQKSPEMVSVAAKHMTVETIKQYFIDCPKGRKNDVILTLLKQYEIKLSIVFCNTKKMVDELTEYMQSKGIMAKGLHGDMRQRERDMVMQAFRRGNVEMLIATDVAARGIDVDDIEAVFNFDIPTQTEYYVHRIGRTGRAGKTGLSFTLAQGRRQIVMIRDIVRYTKTDIEEIKLEGFVADSKNDRFERPRREPERRTGGYDRKPREGGYDRKPREGGYDRKPREAGAEGARPFVQDRGFDKPSYENSFQKREGKPERRNSSEEMYKVELSIGRESNVSPKHILGAVAGESGIKGSEVGAILINGTYSTVEVPMKYKDIVLRSVDGTQIRGKRITAK
ncbi:MAG: DEAD/DEAH box helicase [Oscillospiraceae bacterium]